MTNEDFAEKQASLLKKYQIPEEFHGFASYIAWDIGHSCGYENVLTVFEEILYELKPAIEKYTNKIY